LVQLQKDLGDLEKLGCQVVVISQDSPGMLNKTAKKSKLTFTFLSDGEMEASSGFGLAFSIDEKTNKLYKGFGIDLEGLYGRSQPLMTVPGVFLVNKKGTIVFQYVNPDYRERLDPATLRSAIVAYLKKG
jgi:peroxiredoxin